MTNKQKGGEIIIFMIVFLFLFFSEGQIGETMGF